MERYDLSIWFRPIAKVVFLWGALGGCSGGDNIIGAPRSNPAGGADAEVMAPDSGGGGIVVEGGIGPGTSCTSTMNGTAQGCEFYSVAPAVWAPASGSCFVAVIVNPGNTAVTMKVDIDGTSLDVSQMARIPKGSGANITYEPLPSGTLPPMQTAMLFLSRYDTDDYLDDVDCPNGIVAGLTVADPAIIDTGRGKAFHITTDAPVAAFDIFPYQGKTGALESATLLLPKHVWGKSYIAADPWQNDPVLFTFPNNESCTPFLQIVAAEDDTKVTIRPTFAILGGPGVTSAPAGSPQVYSLAKGEVIQFKRSQQVSMEVQDAVNDRLMGSPISADKPISIWGGSPGFYGFSSVEDPCDSAHQQIPPTTALGFEYVGVRYRNRIAAVNESVPWTLIGVADGTTLTYDPAPPPGAPMTLESGQIAIFDAPDAFTVRSADNKHPFYMAGHMTGYWHITQNIAHSLPDGGQPQFVNVLPPEQWLNDYSFVTDPTFRNTNLVFSRQKAKDGAFKDVTLDCAGALTGWAPIGSGGQYEFTRLDLAVKGAPVGNCDNGPHSAKSAAPFTVTVWGWDTSTSYAYPGGGGVQPINDVPPPK